MAVPRTVVRAAVARWRPHAGTIVLLGEPGRGAPIEDCRLRPWDAALARARGFSLDARLAAGASPDGDWLLAIRSGQLVRAGRRRRLARDWDHLVGVARGRQPTVRAAPLCRDRIIAAEAQIRQLQASLRAELPVPVRGVALARQLLTDAAGPVYNRRSAVDLSAAVRDAIGLMDPATALLPN